MKQNMTFLDFEDEEELEGEDGAFKDTIIEPPSLRPKPNKPAANSQQGRAPTLTIEVVRVGRPLKVLSLLLAILALALLIAASCSSSWMHLAPIRMGVIHACFPMEDGEFKCLQTSCFTIPFIISMILAISGMGFLFVGIILFIAALLVYALIPKRRLYNVTVGMFFVAAITYTICLVIHPIFFLIQFSDEQFQPEGHTHGGGEITPGYALFIGVAGILILLVSTVLLMVDKRADEIIYREKITQ
uniref:p53 induced protein n=1 Tax=Echinococcus granulosus TaxID=6210 RepID=A0A068WWE8_ECHGR|nr:P53 induced protein [Echinococcus granulosus]